MNAELMAGPWQILGLLSFTAYTSAIQPSAPSAVPAPLRELPWAQLNIIHSTDTHGWHAGHLQEASYSADWGDYISFATHLRKKADDDGTDLILVDTGDRVEGNGLYDASDPKGNYTFDIFKHQAYDVICSGNHELYKANSSENEYNINVPNFKGSYVSSNIDIHDSETGNFVPLAPRFKKFTTKNQGIRIIAFGFLYNFKGNANNTKVRTVEDTVKEKWFQDAIRDKDVDLFLVTGHVAIRSPEYDALFKSIRSQRWDTPIAFVGGHTHIRDWKKYDKIAYAIESGRFMETIGFMSIDGLNTGRKSTVSTMATPKFRRRYIDNNLFSYHHHTGLNETTFPTKMGLNVTKQIKDAREALSLDHAYGCAPKNLWLNRVNVTDKDSLFYWLGNQVFPDELRNISPNTPSLVLCNTGALRFDLFEGPFTRDTTYIISPFTSGFKYLRGVKYEYAKKLMGVLNQGTRILVAGRRSLDLASLQSPGQIAAEQLSLRHLYHSLGSVSQGSLQQPLKDPPLIPGYTTNDDDGDDGDDTIHSPISFVPVPNCFQAEVNMPKNASQVDIVDVVYNEFIEQYVLYALQYLGAGDYKEKTAVYFHGKSVTDIITDWVKQHWPCDDSAAPIRK